jgi:type IV pilus assembly protein PilM
MAAGNAVWGIDIGQCALKALKLRLAGEGQVEAVAFDLIEHPKLLSQPDAEPDELVRAALEKFASRNDWQGDRFVLGVPGQQTFARFCKMPPVEQKKIPDLVKFEASQQIPFDIEDVVWDYQAFSAEDSPDLEVGIFAMRKDLIRKQIELLGEVGISPAIVQTIPSALYNFSRFELPDGEDGTAAVIINVGAQNTDLVVVEPNSAWTRNIPLGGNAFTEALVRAFKLSFAKAESLKRTAAASKYARQVFQAMRPVFAELVAEIQRSIGFYSSTHREVELKRVIVLGNAFRLPGLQKYLENNLTIAGGVVRLEKFGRVVPSATINAPQFTENILTFGAAYGLALQGLGLARISASLLPSELARVALWHRKRPLFIATAACLGLAALLPFTRSFLDSQALASPETTTAERTAQQLIAEAERYRDEYQKVQTNTGTPEQSIVKLLELRKNKDLLPQLLAAVHAALPAGNPALQRAETPEELQSVVESGQLPRTQRGQFLVENVKITYVDDVDNFVVPSAVAAAPGAPAPRQTAGTGRVGRTMEVGGPIDQATPGPRAPTGRKRDASRTAAGFLVEVRGRLLFGESIGAAIQFVTEQMYGNIRTELTRDELGFFLPEEDPSKPAGQSLPRPQVQQLARVGAGPRPRGIRTGAFDLDGPSAAAGQPGDLRDPITGENTSTDWSVAFSFKVKIGEKPAAKDEQAEKSDKPRP